MTQRTVVVDSGLLAARSFDALFGVTVSGITSCPQERGCQGTLVSDTGQRRRNQPLSQWGRELEPPQEVLVVVVVYIVARIRSSITPLGCIEDEVIVLLSLVTVVSLSLSPLCFSLFSCLSVYVRVFLDTGALTLQDEAA